MSDDKYNENAVDETLKVPDNIPLPPKSAEKITTACDYCIVACGYNVYRWPVGEEGGEKASENAFSKDFPTAPGDTTWISNNQHNVTLYKGKPHHIAVVADTKANVVNPGGNHSIRGGTIAQKCFNPNTPTKERLQHPMMRVNGKLEKISWDDAFDIMTEVSQHVIAKHGNEAWAMKMFSYQYWENTYALTKLALRHVKTPAFAVHDQSGGYGSDTPGLNDAGIDPFSASYEDWSQADVLFMSGSDPFETKTVLFTGWIMKGIRENGMKVISVVPRKTGGVAHAEKEGGLYLEIIPGTDTVLHMALSRYIIENGWEDAEFVKQHINSAVGTGEEVFQANGFEDYKEWVTNYHYAELGKAEEITGIPKAKIIAAAEMLAKPRADGSRPKSSFGLEKGNYLSNNYLNTASYATLGLICGAGNRPGQVISRFGGHQRGMMPGGDYPLEHAPEKLPNNRTKAIDLDRWVEDGRARFAWVVGTTWLQSMKSSQRLRDSFFKMTVGSGYTITSKNKQHAITVLKQRVDNGGMMVVNQDIYPVLPIGTDIADIVLPAATWGEEDFTRANGERRIRLYSKFMDAPGDAKPDWWIAAQFGKRMGYEGFDWKNSNDVFEEAAWFGRSRRTSYWPLVWHAKNKAKTTGHEYLRTLGTEGIQAPVRYENGKLVGTKRLHDSTLLPGVQESLQSNAPTWLANFKTSTGRANLLKTPWELFSDFYDFMKPTGDELWVTSGRINEIWKSGFDDISRRSQHRSPLPVNIIEIHPQDAKKRGIESGDMVRIESDKIPVQVGGFSFNNAATNRKLTTKEQEGLAHQINHNDEYNNVTYTSDDSTGEYVMAITGNHNHSADDTLENGLNKLNNKLKEDELGELSGLGNSWQNIKAMTFSELNKNGHIQLTSASFDAVAIVTDAIRPNVAFTYFTAPDSEANALSPKVLDPISQRYRHKLGRGVVRRLGESSYKHDFKTMTFKSRAIT